MVNSAQANPDLRDAGVKWSPGCRRRLGCVTETAAIRRGACDRAGPGAHRGPWRELRSSGCRITPKRTVRVEKTSRGVARAEMKWIVERIGPLVPAFATVGASICVSSLLPSTGPQALGPPLVVPPLTRVVGRIAASLSLPAQRLSPGRSEAARPAEHRSLSAPPRRLASSTSYRSSGEVPPVGALPAPPPAPPVTPPAPAVTPPPAPVPVVRASTDKRKPKDTSKPGWGHGDPNHDHTGPPSKGSKGQKDEATFPPTGPWLATGDQHGSAQQGEKKSTAL